MFEKTSVFHDKLREIHCTFSPTKKKRIQEWPVAHHTQCDAPYAAHVAADRSGMGCRRSLSFSAGPTGGRTGRKPPCRGEAVGPRAPGAGTLSPPALFLDSCKSLTQSHKKHKNLKECCWPKLALNAFKYLKKK